MKIKYKFRARDSWIETIDGKWYAEFDDFIRLILQKTILPENILYIQIVREVIK